MYCMQAIKIVKGREEGQQIFLTYPPPAECKPVCSRREQEQMNYLSIFLRILLIPEEILWALKIKCLPFSCFYIYSKH